MSTPVDYKPGSVFSIEEGNNASVPRVFIAPNRYIQGNGCLDFRSSNRSIYSSPFSGSMEPNGQESQGHPAQPGGSG